jgi:hypothetical protein
LREFIENECLLPSLAIGIPEEVFWKKTPKTLAIYFKAYRKQKEEEAKRWSQQMWEMGIYVKWAIATSVFPAGLYDGKHKLPEYPKCPHTNVENNTSEMTEEQLKAERLRTYYYFKSLGKHK